MVWRTLHAGRDDADAGPRAPHSRGASAAATEWSSRILQAFSAATDCEKDFEAGSSVRLTAVADQRRPFPAGAVAAAREAVLPAHRERLRGRDASFRDPERDVDGDQERLGRRHGLDFWRERQSTAGRSAARPSMSAQCDTGRETGGNSVFSGWGWRRLLGTGAVS